MNRKRYWRFVLGLIAIACFLYVGRNYLDQLHRIQEAHLAGIVGIVVVHLLTLWLQGLTLKWGLDSFEKTISQKESFVLFIISSYANLLLPRSGVGTTAVYLNRVRKSSMVDYSSVVVVNAALFVLACSAIGCLLFGFDWVAQPKMPPLWLVIGMPGMLLASLLALAIRWSFLEKYRGPGHSLAHRLNHAMQRLSASNSNSIYRMGMAHFVLVFMRALRLHFAFWALGLEVSFFAVLLTSVLGDLAFVIAITPGALGFREAAVAIAATRLGIPVPLALSVAILDRLVFSMTVVVVAQILIALGFKKGHNENGRPVSQTLEGQQPGGTS